MRITSCSKSPVTTGNRPRRRFLSCTISGLFSAAACTRWLGATCQAGGQAPSAAMEGMVGRFGLPVAGKLQTKRSDQVAASPLSVGFEVLDRQGFDPQRTYPHLAKLGVKWARCQTGWCRCETTPGRYDFGWLDQVVDSLLELGIQPWFNLGYGNRLYTPEADETAVGWAPIFDPKPQAAWLQFTRAIAAHFRGRVQHWEIWNEPNITAFWKPQKPNAADYTELVRITAPEIRRQVPGAVIIGCALAGMPLAYLQGCMEAGLGELVDRVSYHPYRPVPEANYESEVAAMRQLVAKYNPKIHLWQGENGCPSVGGPKSTGALSNLQWDETRQAKWLLRRIVSDLRLELELTSYFHTVDLLGYRGKNNFKGLLRGADYSPKPAYFAYQHLCALFDSATPHCADLQLRLLSGENVHLQKAGFVRGGRAMFAYWYPANLQQGWEPKRVDMALSAAPQAKIDEPVLLDLLDGKAYRPPQATREGQQLVLRQVPLLDYPLLVADRSLIPLG